MYINNALGRVQMRGAKVIVRWFSHEVADLEPTLNLLQQQDRNDYQVSSLAYIHNYMCVC